MKIKFKRDTAFRKTFFVPDSFAHPAKMDAQLLIWIVEHYTEAGETILDPMAGSGITMLASTLGRDVILVELEEKFCKMMRDNWEQVKMRPQLGSTMGDCQIIQGDSRDLQNILFPIPFEEIALALSIGDGYLLIHPNGVTPTLGITHSAKQEAYFNYKCSLLDKIGLTYRRYERERERAGKFHKSLIADTTVDERLVPIHKLLYPAGKKAITAELLNKVTPFILAHWFMDDGYSERQNAMGLSTESHTEQEVILLADWFRSKYTISPSVKKHGTGYILYFRKADAFALANLLRPYIHPSLLYKIDIPTAERSNARQLEGLCDKIISSPPYSDMSMGGGLNTKPPREGHDDQAGRSPKSPSQEGAGGYVDKIVTSPPYGHRSIAGDGITAEKFGTIKYSDETVGFEERRDKKTGRFNPYPFENIGNLPYGEIDKCIFSPPFAGNKGGLKSAESFAYGNDTGLGKRMMGGIKGGTGDNPDNIDSLPYGQIDKIVTSPPYEGSATGKEGGGIKEWGTKKFTGSTSGLANAYSESQDNIGNLKSQSYLEAMLQVYQSCFAVLRDGGLMVLVTKNFIRNKQVIRLDTDTIKLCEQAGFSFVERHYRELSSQSFWRVIYHQKFPDVEQILSEDVLVFAKEAIVNEAS